MASFDLRTLGAIDLRPPDGGPPPRVLHQPKRLAVLAYLTLARPRGPQRRDSLLAIFWPESGERRARNALSQTLHRLRSELGADLLRSSGRPAVGVDLDRLGCDVLRFEDHVHNQRFEDALELYGGDFLPGLHVHGAGEFSHWLDLERGRLRRMARDAARAAAGALAPRSPALAVAVLHRALELFPDSEDLMVLLAELLGQLGDAAGIEAAWETFRRRMTQELEIQPSVELKSRVEAIRTSRRAPAGEVTREIRAVAVLPFRGFSPGASAYSSESMTEALITEMGRVRSLRVLSHQSVVRFKESSQPLREIARILDVDAFVEGAVLEAGGRVRITAQLVRAEPEEHLWADAFDADARDIIAVHRDVARQVAESVSAALSDEDRNRLAEAPTVHPAAYEAFMRGWRCHSTLGPGALLEAAEFYDRALALDPSFAPPRAAMAVVYWMLMTIGEAPVERYLDPLNEAAEAAVDLDPDSGMSHQARAVARLASHDFEAALESAQRATILSPSLAIAQAHLACVHVSGGRFPEAIAAAERTRALDPLGPYAHWLGGWTRHYARRHQDAIQHLQRAIELFPDFPLAWVFLAKSRFELGDAPGTLLAVERSLELMPRNPMCMAYMIHILARMGEGTRAGAMMDALEVDAERRSYREPYYAACALAGLGRVDEACRELDRIQAEASGAGFLLAVDPLMDPLRDEAQFGAVLQRVGLNVS